MNQFEINNYIENLEWTIRQFDWKTLERFSKVLYTAWENKKNIFLCGNGGSAANAIHFANDLIYGVSKKDGIGMKVHALTSNTAVLTCLANDIDYESIFSQQIKVLGSTGDVLIVFSGSGNSPNILRAIQVAKEIGVYTIGILGYDGGKALSMLDLPIHFPVQDMQISEDCQQIVGHIIMRMLNKDGGC